MPQAPIGDDTFAAQLDADGLAVGDETLPRALAMADSLEATSGTMRLSYFTARKQQTSASVRLSTGSTAAAASPTVCRIGLYSIARDSQNVLTGTLVASTANDTTLFDDDLTAYTRAWSTAVAVTPGHRYALGVLVVTTHAAPTLVGQTGLAVAESGIAPRLSGALAGQTDLPASFLDSALATSAGRYYAVLLP